MRWQIQKGQSTEIMKHTVRAESVAKKYEMLQIYEREKVNKQNGLGNREGK